MKRIYGTFGQIQMSDLSLIHMKYMLIAVLWVVLLPTGVFSQQQTAQSYIESEVYQIVNEYRASQKRRKLIRKSELDKIALKHAQDMAAGRQPFSHNGFKKRVKAVQVYARVPYRVAENLYAIPIDARRVPAKALQGWIDSPGHHVNLRGDFLFTGIAAACSEDGEWFVVQLYVGKND